ncbi:glycosyltransferase family 4 protein [Pseudofrankia sp. BMG5.37]|nr:glycosyltransferase family 4 protein [Pseudofrankia sp. BMG5.37]
MPHSLRPVSPGSSLPPGSGGAPTTPRVLLLAAPAGPGVERYVGAVEEALLAGGATLTRLDLPPAGLADGLDRPETVRPGEPGRRGLFGRRTDLLARTPFGTGAQASTGAQLAARVDVARRAAGAARRFGHLDALVAGHPSLLKAAAGAASLGGARRVPVLCYGADIWRMPPTDRALLARHPLVYPVTVSSFSAGALAGTRLARLLPPGVPAGWRAALLAEGARRRPQPPVPTVLSVFPLTAWADKGLPTLLAALETARAELGRVRLVVAGHGPAPGALHELLSAPPDTELHESPEDETLARLYATADLYALCTRTRTGGTRPSGEGYGLTLLEAQLAGCAVVGPAHGGSRDAYQEGVTGVTPVDESPRALAQVLVGLLRDRARLTRIGRRGAEWAESVTRPDDHLRAVFQTLLGVPPTPPPDPPAAAIGAAAAPNGSVPSDQRAGSDRPRTLPAASLAWPRD